MCSEGRQVLRVYPRLECFLGPALCIADPMAEGEPPSLSLAFHGEEKRRSDGVRPQFAGSPETGGIWACPIRKLSVGSAREPPPPPLSPLGLMVNSLPPGDKNWDEAAESAVMGLESRDIKSPDPLLRLSSEVVGLDKLVIGGVEAKEEPGRCALRGFKV